MMWVKMSKIQVFRLIRKKDESGYSGVGIVLTGIIFENGMTVIQWTAVRDRQSIAIYKDFDDFKHFHVDGHPTNESEIQYLYDSGYLKRRYV